MNITRAITKEVHISTIKGGDTIVYNGKLKTVSFKDIKRSPFMGVTIFGDYFNIGYKKATKVVGWN